MLGNALQMRNAGLQSNIFFYLQSIHFTLLILKNACHMLVMLVMSTLKAPYTTTFSARLSDSDIFHLSASLVLRYNLLFVCLFFLCENQKSCL